MFYFLAKNQYQLSHVSSGRLVASSDFIHPNRVLDSVVLLVGLHGKIFVQQDDRQFTLEPNSFITLFPGHRHFGYRSSIPDEGEDEVSYFWCHFQLTDNFYHLLNEEEIKQRFSIHGKAENQPVGSSLSQYYILPEFGYIRSSTRTITIFNQLLDISSQQNYSPQITNYALSLLCMQISQDFYTQRDGLPQNSDRTHYNMLRIMQWISLHYNEDPSITQIAERFNYNADYLSTVFKRYSGDSLVRYINKTKIAAAKKLLLSTDYSVREIAERCGYRNDKYFLKVFHQLEDLTPTQYRNAFCMQYTNKE